MGSMCRSMRMKAGHLWIVALVLVVLAALYQRRTGPSYPITGTVRVGPGAIRFNLPRSHAGKGDAEIRVPASDPGITGTIRMRRYRSSDPWLARDLIRQGDFLVGRIPHQLPAGKVAYQVSLSAAADPVSLTPRPIILRFRGDIPALIMVPHILLMFLAMLFSTRAGLEAIVKGPNVTALAAWTVSVLFAGGLVLGPIVQKFAFDAYWTGWPLGQDLTDNKTVVGFLFWLLAVWRIQRRERYARAWTIAASVALILVYLIPHSVFGSELSHTESLPLS